MINSLIDSVHILIEAFNPRNEEEYIAIFNLTSAAGLNTEDIDTRDMPIDLLKHLAYEGYDCLAFDIHERERMQFPFEEAL